MSSTASPQQFEYINWSNTNLSRHIDRALLLAWFQAKDVETNAAITFTFKKLLGASHQTRHDSKSNKILFVTLKHFQQNHT